MADAVNHPAHYNSHASGVECIDINEELPSNLGAAFKYVWRAGLKGSKREDLLKALWYVRRECARLKKPKDQRLVSYASAWREAPPLAVERLLRTAMDQEENADKRLALQSIFMGAFRSYYRGCAMEAIGRLLAAIDTPEQAEARDEMKKLGWKHKIRFRWTEQAAEYEADRLPFDKKLVVDGTDPVADLALMKAWLIEHKLEREA